MKNSKTIALIIAVVLVLFAVLIKTDVITVPNSDKLTDDSSKYTYDYPEDFGSEYVSAVDWPPTLDIANGPVNCVETSGSADMGRITRKNINNELVCLVVVQEGAAGSEYNRYFYAVEREKFVFVYGFTTQEVRCESYSDEQAQECAEVQSTFKPDDIAERMITTTKLNGKVVN